MRMAVLWSLLLLSCLAFQAAFLPLFLSFGARPDLLLIIVVSAGLLRGKEIGVGVGFFAGILQDLASGNIFGLNTLAKMAAGYIAGLAEGKVFKENILLPLLAVTMATFFNACFVFTLIYFWGYKVEFLFLVFNQVLPTLAYNLAFSIPIHRLIFRLLLGRG
ncbi:MAG TPA: rod shape-determining protein MreD [Methylomusa anaerophila]|uniref:Rod shape-determining protein MreD n=1 Tax=Methylomusa anaerophila TaxID=1930071 RepID=A0A348AFA4_9FIRM|nr:rod shape-determining protein MreD [Methylomusa anaerophila]BBB89752.1 rod shape-determining protein MreD [Methylomusa anaerophila]HML89202.1 rod shape-determining protein MreD [Methylomusa anaerophila]